MLILMLFGAPMAYTALNLYLLAKIQPIPITFLTPPVGERTRARGRVAA